MTLGELSIILGLLGIVLLVAELMLPTHGVLALTGLGSLVGMIVSCFLINIWLGVGAMSVGAGLTPLVLAWLVNVWPRTRFGRQWVLPGAQARPLEPLPVQIGQTGTTVSELRPMGTCEFAGQRIEAISELGIIPPGKQIRVVNITNRRPTVRAIG
jgi:membrane-bound serine protease (ClpP class)